jgi:hypothetical protein
MVTYIGKEYCKTTCETVCDTDSDCTRLYSTQLPCVNLHKWDQS